MRKSTRPRRLPSKAAAALAACLIATGALGNACASRRPVPLTPPPVVDARDHHVRELQKDIARLLDVPELRRGVAAVVLRSADHGDTLFRYHDETLVMPASNMKILTLAAAAERLGWDYTFPTTFSSAGPLVEGVLDGDLVVTGTGDPSIGTREDPASAVMDRWAEQLWAKGLRTIEGRIVGDDRAFSGEPLGAGWPWDTLAWGYSAPVGALQANVDAAEVHIAAAAREGDPASVALVPSESGLELEQAVFTGPASGTASIELARAPGTTRLKVTGVIPLGSEPLVRTAAVDHPTRYFLSLLASALARRGILVRDGVAPIRDLPAAEWPNAGAPVLLEHRSATLRDLAQTVMKSSQNQYAETLLRVLARSEPGAVATTEGGRGVVRRVLAGWGIPADSFVQADGSGLSRYNYVAAGTLADVLAHMYRDPRHRGPWIESLAVGGVDGTLDKRFKGTSAEGRVRGKTGSIANVRALSGYVTAANGEQVLFVIVFNNVTAPGPRLTAISDGIVVRLTRFTR